jgi:hypothetical protein
VRTNGAITVLPARYPPLRVFLGPEEDLEWITFMREDEMEEEITSPDDSRLILLGRLSVDADGSGRLRFTVPDVAPGLYQTVTHCVPCAPYSAGRELLPTGAFVVLPAPGQSEGLPVTPFLIGFGSGAAMAVAGVLLLARRARRQRLPS